MSTFAYLFQLVVLSLCCVVVGAAFVWLWMAWRWRREKRRYEQRRR